jgi:NADPH2:quinone reductase
MKKILVHTHGGPETLTVDDVPVPEPGPAEALVAIAASGVNFIDVYFRTGFYAAEQPTAIGS